MASIDLGLSSRRAQIPQDSGFPWDVSAPAAVRALSGDREEGKLWDLSFRGQPTLTHSTAAFLGLQGGLSITSHQGRAGTDNKHLEGSLRNSMCSPTCKKKSAARRLVEREKE